MDVFVTRSLLYTFSSQYVYGIGVNIIYGSILSNVHCYLTSMAFIDNTLRVMCQGVGSFRSWSTICAANSRLFLDEMAVDLQFAIWRELLGM